MVPFSARRSDIRSQASDSARLARAALPHRAVPRQHPRRGTRPAGSLRAGLLRDTLPSGAEDSRSLLKGSGAGGSASLHSAGVFGTRGLRRAQLLHGEGSSQVILAAATACCKSVRDLQGPVLRGASQQGKGLPVISLLLPPQLS